MSQDRITLEEAYWNENALDKEVDVKYIADISKKDCLEDLTGLRGAVLEIGCGVGRLLQDGYCGIDISNNMLAIAMARGVKAELKLCDGRTIPYDDNSFDTVFSYLVFQHLPASAVRGYIEESYRVLNSKGLLVFQFIEGKENEPFSHHYSKEQIKQFASMFSKICFKTSVAYKNWTVAECYV